MNFPFIYDQDRGVIIRDVSADIEKALPHIKALCEESKMPLPVVLSVPVKALLQKMKAAEVANFEKYESALDSYNKLLSELSRVAANNKCKKVGGYPESYANLALAELGYMQPKKPKSLSGYISRLELQQNELLEIEENHDMLAFLDQE